MPHRPPTGARPCGAALRLTKRRGCAMADQEGSVFLTLLKDKALWLLLRPVMILSMLLKKQKT